MDNRRPSRVRRGGMARRSSRRRPNVDDSDLRPDHPQRRDIRHRDMRRGTARRDMRRGTARRDMRRLGSRAGRRMRRRPMATSHYTRAASQRLTRFRQASRLAVALTGLLILLWSTVDPNAAVAQQPQDELTETTPEATTETTPEAPTDDEAIDDTAAETPADISAETPAEIVDDPPDAADAVNEARGAIEQLASAFVAILPKALIALSILLLAFILSRLIRKLFKRFLSSWSRAAAASALTSVTLFLIALGAALSVIAGDARALVGSVGLAGLALSWALQTPIESFTGWLLNSFKSYYRIGDRIEVGDIFGDVYQIDLMTTTVWELGGPDKDVRGAQPTGALVTFPNSEVLRASIINYTRDFTHVWDEVVVGIANESDVPYAMDVAQRAAADIIGAAMEAPARQYARLLEERDLAFEVATEPTVYVSLTDAWTNLIVRYLVPARERRKWATELVVGIGRAFNRPEHEGKIIPAYPRTQVELLDHDDHDGHDGHDPRDTRDASNGGRTHGPAAP